MALNEMVRVTGEVCSDLPTGHERKRRTAVFLAFLSVPPQNLLTENRAGYNLTFIFIIKS